MKLVTIVLLFLTSVALGCDGRVHTLKISKSIQENIDFDRNALVDLTSHMAMKYEYVQETERSNDIDLADLICSFRSDGQGWAKTGFSLIRLREPPNQNSFIIDVVTFPSFDYPMAKSFRNDFLSAVQNRFGTQRIRKFWW